MIYITPDDLKAKFGDNWATDADLEDYSDLVNAWMTKHRLPTKDQTSIENWIEIKKGAFFLARAAKSNELYFSEDGLKSEKASAESGTFVETSYFAYKNAMSYWVKAALDLFDPYMSTELVFFLPKIN